MRADQIRVKLDKRDGGRAYLGHTALTAVFNPDLTKAYEDGSGWTRYVIPLANLAPLYEYNEYNIMEIMQGAGTMDVVLAAYLGTVK